MFSKIYSNKKNNKINPDETINTISEKKTVSITKKKTDFHILLKKLH